MLTELRIRDLGVIAAVDVVLRPGMTAVTGETGAGKTLLVQAIDLLVGGRADATVVRSGAAQAEVEGRFLAPAGAGVDDRDDRDDRDGDDGADGGNVELVLRRVVPVTGRSRAYLDGRMAQASTLAVAGGKLVDIHGQHAHQSLLSPAVQRAALDAFGGIEDTRRASARRHLAELDGALAVMGGDERSRAREIDLLGFQVDELARAALSDPNEDHVLRVEEDRLAEVAAHREAATRAYRALSGDEGGAADAVGLALSAVSGRGPLAELAERVGGIAAEVAEAASDLRRAAEALEEDPARLEQVRARRLVLRELRRKYGESLADVVAYAGEARARLEELSSHGQRVALLEQERAGALEELADAEAELAEARRDAGRLLASAVAGHLQDLAMPGARFEVEVGGQPDQVTFLLGANPGEAALPLSRVASGGELARTMLALRLVLGGTAAASDGQSTGPPTVVFDEVDAGVGGEAALAVGRALTGVAAGHGAPQVLVVTHLAQVAAFADHQLVVRKLEGDGRTVVEAEHVEGGARVVELSRMLSGHPDSPAARDHAQELLAVAARGRRP